MLSNAVGEKKKIFLVQVGEHMDTTAFYEWDAEEAAQSPDGLYWSTRGPATDSFPEVEARALLLAKTYKHIRILAQETEIIGHVE